MISQYLKLIIKLQNEEQLTQELMKWGQYKETAVVEWEGELKEMGQF